MTKITFYEIQLPTDIAYGASGGPEFSTDIVTSSSGYEQRNINWNIDRNRYNLAPSIKTYQQLQELLSFFRLCRGKAIGFRFKDWADYQLVKQKIAIADGVLCKFQLIKTYSYGVHEAIRKISKPVLDSIKVYVDEVEMFPICDCTSGSLIFLKPPKEGSIITVDGEFDVPVRFDIDCLSTAIENYGVYTHHEIPLIEIKIC